MKKTVLLFLLSGSLASTEADFGALAEVVVEGLPQENLLQLTITDDGVGRARAAELKSKSASHQKSFGLKITSERIALVNQLYQTHTQVTIEDLVDTDGQPAGTGVILQIPI